MPKFTISDLKFDIQSATLEPFFDDPSDEPLKNHRLVWGVVVTAMQKKGKQAGWNPRFTSERLLETKPKEIETWRELAKYAGTWDDASEDEERALLTTFEHEPVINVKWSFALSVAGRLSVTLDGFSKFNHPGGYKGLLPIHIDTELDFAPIPMGEMSKAACKRQLVQFGLSDPLEFRVDDDISFLDLTDYPRR
jgi:hypothetical protein